MNKIMVNPQRKILLAYYPIFNPKNNTYEAGVSQKRISDLKKNSVKSIFIILANEVDLDAYFELAKIYESEGFKITNYLINHLGKDQLPYVKELVEEINRSFKRESCLIVSYGESYTGTVIACYNVLKGFNIDEAVEKAKKFDQKFIGKPDEISFIRDFQKFLKNIDDINNDIFKEKKDESILKSNKPTENFYDYQKSDNIYKREAELDNIKESTAELNVINTIPETQQKISEKPVAEELDLHEQITPIENDEIPIKEELPEAEIPEVITINDTSSNIVPLETEIAHKENLNKEPAKNKNLNKKGLGIFNSIRFKLIFIISLIIVISLSIMIFVASYFFKKDNRIRIEENNHKISSITALKVESDFSILIERSKIIINMISKNNSDYDKALIENDKDFIFIGIAENLNNKKSLKFIKSYYNKSLIDDNQISQDNIHIVQNTSNKNFIHSFNGDLIVKNLSQGFKMPVIGLSLPFDGNYKGKSKAIIVSYIKLDRFLQAFKQSKTGITNVLMVNGDGEIVAHTNTSIIISGGNYNNIPIFEMMKKSKQDNGFQRFKDENGVYHLGSFQKIDKYGCGIIATVKEEVAFQEVENMQRRNIYLTGIVLVIVILIIFFFGKTITTPIIDLVGATSRIKEGRYRINIKPTTRDEIGQLTRAFIEMGHGLEEREKMKDAFGKFVNKQIAEQVLKGQIRLGGERKDVAIFFSDIRSFTEISEKLEPEEVVEFLNQYMTRMVKCVNDTNGVVDKYIGDAIMAVWGAPVTTGNDTENAINASLLMRKELIQFNKDRGSIKKPKIRIGCAINTGPVLAGQIGSNEKMEYTVIGDAVNLASRIESLNKPFGTDVLISEDSYKLVKNIYRFEPMQKIKVKGKHEPQQIYAVLGRLDDPSAPKTLEELRSLVGIEMKGKLQGEAKEEVKYEILQ